MACLTTPDEVLEIMSGTTLTVPQVHPFVKAAHLVIEKVFEYDTTAGLELKTELEKWLTAHLVTSIYGMVGVGSGVIKREKVGDAEIEYATATFGKGLDASPYGKMLRLLDTTGLLANAGKMAASIYAIKQFE
jgi:hypothetical protein